MAIDEIMPTEDVVPLAYQGVARHIVCGQTMMCFLGEYPFDQLAYLLAIGTAC